VRRTWTQIGTGPLQRAPHCFPAHCRRVMTPRYVVLHRVRRQSPLDTVGGGMQADERRPCLVHCMRRTSSCARASLSCRALSAACRRPALTPTAGTCRRRVGGRGGRRIHPHSPHHTLSRRALPTGSRHASLLARLTMTVDGDQVTATACAPGDRAPAAALQSAHRAADGQ